MINWFFKKGEELFDRIDDIFKSSDTHPDFETMTKLELEAYGRKFGIELDRRKKKSTLILELKNHVQKSDSVV